MKIYSILIIVTSITAISCRNNSSIKNKILNNDSSLTMKSDKSAKRIDSIKNCSDKLIELKCLKYCGKGNFTDKKGNGEEPFKINKVVKNDSLFISFCFISDGCQNFVKETKITKDTLFLDYKTNSNTICEIYSEYYYEFIIPKCNWNVIYLKTKKI